MPIPAPHLGNPGSGVNRVSWWPSSVVLGVVPNYPEENESRILGIAPSEATMDDLSRFCCQIPQCPDHGKRDAKNLTVTARYGPDQQRRMLRCRTCKARFSERKGTVFFHAKLPPETVGSILEHLSERCGIRATGRLCQVNRATVGRYAALAGGHAHDLHEDLVAFSPSEPRSPVR